MLAAAALLFFQGSSWATLSWNDALELFSISAHDSHVYLFCTTRMDSAPHLTAIVLDPLI
jgi:hypothetical protein